MRAQRACAAIRSSSPLGEARIMAGMFWCGGGGGKTRFLSEDKRLGIIDDCLNEICTKRYVYLLVREVRGVFLMKIMHVIFLGQENMTADNHLETGVQCVALESEHPSGLMMQLCQSCCVGVCGWYAVRPAKHFLVEIMSLLQPSCEYFCVLINYVYLCI